MEHIEIRMRDCSHNLDITAPPLSFNFLKNINKIQMPPITETFANMVIMELIIVLLGHLFTVVFDRCDFCRK